MELTFLFLGHFTEVEAGKGEAGLEISGNGRCRSCIDQINHCINQNYYMCQ